MPALDSGHFLTRTLNTQSLRKPFYLLYFNPTQLVSIQNPPPQSQKPLSIPPLQTKTTIGLSNLFTTTHTPPDREVVTPRPLLVQPPCLLSEHTPGCFLTSLILPYPRKGEGEAANSTAKRPHRTV
ncbi:hypothetical protein TNIN_444821 [Trichonephila inaurata madagascariensis]|uniref:Uncharacterized protein n=1 Tax=Trichonephila inaurata madagascariensis TaxID=2747483 RepID=A0A8X6YWA0_9ARAC|nr:hypothetical protein TNIN_444821 [Trichonephila inaurata madagascariensis]